MKNYKTFLSLILMIALQCVIPLNMFDEVKIAKSNYESETTSLTNIFIELPEKYNEKEVNQIIDRINLVPPRIIDNLIGKKEKMRLINGKLTDEPEYEYLKGQVPRGWENTGCTWDDVPGIAGNPIVVRIDCSNSNTTHSSTCLELHEISHRTDTLFKHKISETSNFKSIWKQEAPKLFKNNPYFINNPDEYFAESYAMYLLNEKTRKLLEKDAPLTYRFFLNDSSFNHLQKSDLSLYRFDDKKLCGSIYKNKEYKDYESIEADSEFTSTDNIYIGFAVTNYGLPTVKPIKICLWVDGKLIFRAYENPMGQGHIRRLWNIKIGKLTPGKHSIIYEADSNYLISEENENNNWAQINIEVK